MGPTQPGVLRCLLWHPGALAGAEACGTGGTQEAAGIRKSVLWWLFGTRCQQGLEKDDAASASGVAGVELEGDRTVSSSSFQAMERAWQVHPRKLASKAVIPGVKLQEVL